MSDGVHPDSGDAGLFDAIDPKLTVFALANGMDLKKGDDHRRVEWFTEGFERGILIEVDAPGSFRLNGPPSAPPIIHNSNIHNRLQTSKKRT